MKIKILKSDKITFGKARIEDVLRISILLKTVYIETYASEGITFEFANFIEEQFAPQKIEDKIKNEPDQLIIAYYNGNPIGVAEILYDIQCPILKIQASEVGKLYVLHRFVGKGVGYKLLTTSEEMIKQKGFDKVNIEVYIKNERAITFYERQGYQKIGKIDFPIEENTYVNWVMTKKLLE